ncbi:MAG: hypothetical protein VXZ40_00100 [Nanoarchaeota archaeon]|nr:hypothetical protein [Nanoarchaeota archaeon]
MINKAYLGDELKKEMQDFFNENVFLQLNEFLDKEHNTFRKALLTSTNFKKVYNPLLESKSVLNLKEEFSINILRFVEYFKSKEFIAFLEDVVEFSLQVRDVSIVFYEQKDFKLLSDLDTGAQEDYLEIIYDLSDEWDESYGGIQTYTTKEEEILHLEPQYNTLTILYKPEEVMKYLKYINSRSKDKKILRVEMKFDIVEVEN